MWGNTEGNAAEPVEKASKVKPVLYFESHVTVDPVVGARLDQLKLTANRHDFKVAELLMVKNELPSDKDCFMSARGPDFECLKNDMHKLLLELDFLGFKPKRYKIEEVILDSRFNDLFHMLPTQQNKERNVS